MHRSCRWVLPRVGSGSGSHCRARTARRRPFSPGNAIVTSWLMEETLQCRTERWRCMSEFDRPLFADEQIRKSPAFRCLHPPILLEKWRSLSDDDSCFSVIFNSRENHLFIQKFIAILILGPSEIGQIRKKIFKITNRASK